MQLIIGTSNPYDWNSVIAKRMKQKTEDLPTPEFMKLNQDAKMVGQFLGVDTTHDWSAFYDKIWNIYQWARVKTQSEDINKLIGFIQEKLNSTPAMNGKRINDLHIAFKLDSMRPAEESDKTKVEEKEESKEEIVEKKEEETTN